MRPVPHRRAFSALPLLMLAASFACGVLLMRLATPPLSYCLFAGAVLTLSAAVAFARGRLTLATALVLLALSCAGAASASVEKSAGDVARLRGVYERGQLVSGEPVEVTGVLERAPEPSPVGLRLSLRVESLGFKGEEFGVGGRVELFAPLRERETKRRYAELELRHGARVRVACALGRAERYRNPGVTAHKELLDARDVDARCSIKSPLLVERLDDDPVFLPFVWLDAWRARLLETSDEILSAEASGVFKAATLGNRAGLSREAAERFREGGTFHVLVISGLHVTFVGGVAWLAVRALTRQRALQWAVAVSLVWAYAVAVGAEASVVRASLAFTVLALAPVLGRTSNTLNALGCAALVLLANRPGELFDPSFQLTFLSVLAIASVALPLLAHLRAAGEWRPTRATPYPPVCPDWWRRLGETLFWSERRWRRDMSKATHDYRLFKSPLAERLERWKLQALLRYAFAAMLVSAAVQLVLLPLLVVYFHRLSPAALPLNVFVSALMVAFVFSALAALALSHVGTFLAAPLAWLAETLNRLVTHGVDPFAALDVASIRLPEYSGPAAVVYALYFVPLLALTRALSNVRPVGEVPSEEDESSSRVRRQVVRLSAASLVALFALMVVHPLSAGLPDGRLRLDFLDVGQGDATLLTMPDGTTMLVDGGGRLRFDSRAGEGADLFEPDARGVGEAVVSEYLWWRGLGRVNYVVATHADADHVEGLNDVLKNFAVDAALVGRAPPDDAEFARFSSTARREGVPVYLVGRGDVLRFGGATVEILWPPRSGQEQYVMSSNDASLVLRVSLGRRAFLLTGDVETRAEAALLAAGDRLQTDVVKVAHHGSRTSSTEPFVRATSPSLAVVPVGLESPYGHPHPSVVERWRAAGAELLTTGARGTITVSTDGEDLRIETFVEP